MCVIIINRRETLSHNILRQASAYNPDGAGMMWYSNHLNIYKSLNNEKVVKEYYNLRKKFHGTIILHFRFATHGRIDAVNTQPISVNENVAIVHNGIIAGYGNRKYSDTYMFAKDIDVNLLEDMKYLQYLQSLIKGSRFVIMNKNKIIILNRHLFYEVGDSLYSNLYFLSWKKYW
ncbi:MAG: hypothetical protein GYA16_15620 [Spirochaetes bacterium]|nr:hypothetical protein [Spirochaetota bacterium]